MYTFESRIRYSEIDSDGNLTMNALLNYFQDVTTFHSEALGLGIDYMNRRKLIWVLASWQIVVERMPGLGEQVTVGTLPYDFKGFMGYRNFIMQGTDGSCIAKANTIWILLDLQTGKPAAVPKEMKDGYTLEPKLEMEYASRKILMPEHMQGYDEIVMKKHHLDTNQHVNNGQYVNMAMEFLPENFIIKQLRAEYKKQARLDDILYPFVACEQDRWVVQFQDEKQEIYACVELSGE